MLRKLAPSIRPLATADVPTILLIEREGYGHPWTERMFLDEFLNPHAVLLGSTLEESSALTGYIFGSLADQVIDIRNIAVTKRYRRKGFGSSLLKAVMNHARCSEANQLILEVDAENSEALSFYKAHGFQIVSKRERYYPNMNDAMVMKIVLG